MAPLSSKENLEVLAAGQGGRLHRRQLSDAGMSRDAIRSWVRRRILIPTVTKQVFALGYQRTDHTALLWDAILYAGPDAALTGACAAHQLGLLLYQPRTIKVQTPRQHAPHPDFVMLKRRSADTEIHDGIPYATMPDLLLEIACEGNTPILRRSLESLDYQRMLDMAAVHAACGRGRRGSVPLTHALTHRLPALARCKSPLEIAFLLLLEAHHLPIPRVNESLHGEEPDMYWPELNLVVELDGDANHHSPAQKRRDQRKDRKLRSHGLTVIRLSYDDVHQDQAATLMTLARNGVTPTR